jgi:DNA-binding GntR family transcriptional regulator
MIMIGELRPGDWLRQDQLAEIFGVSTMPIREALRHLQAEGLVTFHARRGATVAKLSIAEYEEIYRIREELEVLACRWASEDFDRIQADRMLQLLAEIEEAEENSDDVHLRLQLVRDFFFTVFLASEKKHLLRLISGLWDRSQQYRRYYSTFSEVIPQRIANYRQIYVACVARDTEMLVSALRNIYAFGRTELIPRVREEDSAGGDS